MTTPIDRRVLLKMSRFSVQRWAFDNGHDHDVVVHPGAVVILPVLADQRIVMIHNVRYAVARELQELPAGTLEHGEAPQSCAARELEEETGYKAGHIAPLGTFFTCPGICTEKMHAFVATELSPTAQRLEPSERIRTEIVTQEEAMNRVRDGRIEDAKTISCLTLYMQRGA
jgi:ADP-ribose pyrophosphatase